MLRVRKITRGASRVTVAGLWLSILFAQFFAVPVSAQGSNALAHGFHTTNKNIVTASLVGLKKGSANTVELAASNKVTRLVGVVSDKPLVELSDNTSTVQVVTSGLTLGLISDINGVVVAGDRITASPIAGVGMKATESSLVVGTAQANLADVDTETRVIKDATGTAQKVRIGLMPLQVAVGLYAPVASESAAYVPPFLQDLANNLAGRVVSPIRVLVAATIFVLFFVSVIVLLYAAVRTSITSIGRNPLSESAVRKSLTEVGIAVMAVLIFAGITIYLVLTL